ncbi:hypothetical protein [Croceivirga thetidis]|uniref:HTH luxR-type domain-containing protein n=1 Tax=Croceivirga thetidis TaxID=2721623 RepID=A0ABX1GRB8_9FLAO|nr:hypothetical protein [Croceivirga thetidis]NKI32492.1 hypothetical protein [Croceivirga thetidis]
MRALHVVTALVLLVFTGTIAQQSQKLDSLLTSYAAQVEDSLKVQTAHTLYEAYLESNPKRADFYAQKALEISQRIGYKSGIAKSNHRMGKSLLIARELDAANEYFEKSLVIYKELDDPHHQGLVFIDLIQLDYVKPNYNRALARINEKLSVYSKPKPDSLILLRLYNIQAKVYTRQTNYAEGFESALKALSIAEQLKLPAEIVKVKGILGNLYHYTNDKAKAIAIKEENLEYYRKQNNRRKIGHALNDIGNSYYVIEEYKLALRYLEESLSFSEEVGNQGLIGITLFNIGKTHIRLGAIQKGITFLKRSVNHSRYVSQHALSESWALKRLGDVYTEELRTPEKALPYLDRAIILADSIGNKDDLYQSYRDRSQAYEAMGFYDKAIKDFERYKTINDSVYNIERSKEIEHLKKEFETREKEQQIVLQKKEITVLEQQASIGSLQRILLVVALVFSMIIFYALWQRLKRNRQEKEKINAELAFKKKELTTNALHLAKKNEVLESLKQKAEELKVTDDTKNGYQQLIRTINFDLQDDNNWENFARYFEAVHKDFNRNVKAKYPQVTSNELRLLALLKMELSSKEIANILNISKEGIKKARYRLRKKLKIETDDSLQELVITL